MADPVPDLPVAVERSGDEWLARPVGPTPGVRLLRLLGAGAPTPAGFRWAPGTHPGVQVAAVERPVGVDQTNTSVVVGDRVVVKWTTVPLVGPHPAPERLRRLVAAGFDGMPRVWGGLEWRTPGGHWVPVATAVDLIRGATDGWTWCLHEARVALGVRAGPGRPFAPQLGALTATMHLALADPASPLVAVHGDLHVGQVLRDPAGRLSVIDFDGNPTSTPADRVAHRPAAYDVAGLLLSLENVGHVVCHHDPHVSRADASAWSARVQHELLDAYRERAGHLLDESLLDGYVEHQIQRELAYAETYLPRWRYVPEAALRLRGLRAQR